MTGASSAAIPPLAAAPPRRLRTASSAASLRLQAFGGVLHSGDMDSNSSSSSIFENMTLRWAGCASGTGTGAGAGQPLNDGSKHSSSSSTFWPDWNWTGQESSNEDILDIEEETEYQGSEASLATPTFPLPVAVAVPVVAANNNTNNIIVDQATPTKKQRQQHPPIQRIHGQECMPDQTEAEAEGKDHYSSLEHVSQPELYIAAASGILMRSHTDAGKERVSTM